jgi:NhaB family Na+:H+ antiporter
MRCGTPEPVSEGSPLVASFLGHAPRWYKQAILGLLVANLILLTTAGPAVTGWAIVAEFIFTLAMALKCHPLGPGGLLALQAVLLGLTTPERVYAETLRGMPVLLLLIFMVTAIYFMRELLLYLFSLVLIAVRSQTLLALLFCLAAAMLSAFLDALTVLAAVMSVAMGLYTLYQRTAASSAGTHADLESLRAALRGLLMHTAVGTALGGVMTLVGEPQNVLIARDMGWDFAAFFNHMAPVSVPVLLAGLATCVLVDRFRLFGFGTPIPESARAALLDYERHAAARRTRRDAWRLAVQAACALLLIAALALHVGEVGLIGLAIVVLLTALLGVSEEQSIAQGFQDAMPFAALLIVFFAIVAVIQDQQLFRPEIAWVLGRNETTQAAWLFLANGLLSAVSDNVFVATVYMGEMTRAFQAGLIRAPQMNSFAVAINTGTNIPSIATPNGQAAFLFLLTSALAPMLRLSYARMVWMALPYLIVLTTVGLLAVIYLLP